MHSPLFESLALVSHDNVFLWIHTDRVVPGLMLHLTPPGCDGNKYVKFIYSEKATKLCKIFILLLSYVVPVKSKVKISQNFVAFSECMNFKF
jgi:hypothetical protein